MENKKRLGKLVGKPIVCRPASQAFGFKRAIFIGGYMTQVRDHLLARSKRYPKLYVVCEIFDVMKLVMSII